MNEITEVVSVVFTPSAYLSSLYSQLTLYRRCGLAYPYDGREADRGPLSIQSSLILLLSCFLRDNSYETNSTCTVSIDLQMYLVYSRERQLSVRQAYS